MYGPNKGDSSHCNIGVLLEWKYFALKLDPFHKCIFNVCMLGTQEVEAERLLHLSQAIFKSTRSM